MGARQVFPDEGFQGAAVSAIASRVGIVKGLVRAWLRLAWG
ncbi:TetR family transcriptional regulator [Verminephrobacter eiseniae]|nr:TetR family transcriptional regulator [Verminephrobacter eiseniae]